MRTRLLPAICAAALIGTSACLAQEAEESEFVMALMTTVNHLSIRFGREACGFVLQDEDGRFSSSKVQWGTVDGCAPLLADDDPDPLSSWHTHGSYAPEYDNEVPSVDDVLGDLEEGTTGWVGTPGGRLWYIAAQEGALWETCGVGCLPHDPTATDALRAPVPSSMSFYDLYYRFEDAGKS